LRSISFDFYRHLNCPIRTEQIPRFPQFRCNPTNIHRAFIRISIKTHSSIAVICVRHHTPISRLSPRCTSDR